MVKVVDVGGEELLVAVVDSERVGPGMGSCGSGLAMVLLLGQHLGSALPVTRTKHSTDCMIYNILGNIIT